VEKSKRCTRFHSDISVNVASIDYDDSYCCMHGEQEEESTEGGDGVFGYTRLFECASHKGYFTGLENVSKDSRFAESSQFIHRNPNLSE